MTTQVARRLLVGSLLLLVAVIVAWTVGSDGEQRSDLQGAPIVAAPVSTSTAPPVNGATSTVPTTEAPKPVGVPKRILIPSLGVDATIDAVGLERDGSMEVPGATETGWYRYGPRPGSTTGSAVIAAHVDFNGVRGVFFDLRSLASGAELTVTDDSGVAHRFVVSERFQVGKSQLPIADLFRVDGIPTLTLITCGGGFDQRHRTYNDNIVVRAVPADPT